MRNFPLNTCCIILICSFLCSAVLGFLCKNGHLFLISAIKSLGNFLILLNKNLNILLSSSVLNFGVLSSISFFFQQNRIDFFFCTILKHNVIEFFVFCVHFFTITTLFQS